MDLPRLGEGIGWRPELALAIERREGLGFVEIIAESFFDRPVPAALRDLRKRGVVIVPHAITLSLGGAERPDRQKLKKLAELAERVEAPLVSEHLCFVRGGGRESGHLLPLPGDRETLGVVVENVGLVRDALPVPLALENIATLFDWPGRELSEAAFARAVCEATGTLLLLDIENVYANARNGLCDANRYLDETPLDRVAYVHIAGGKEHEGIWHDTHTAPVAPGALELLRELARRTPLRGVMLERDDRFPPAEELYREMDAIAMAWHG